MTFFTKKRTEKEKNIHISRCLRQAQAACGRNSEIEFLVFSVKFLFSASSQNIAENL